MKVTLHNETFAPWISISEIQAEVKRLATEIRADYGHTVPITLVCVLKGAIPFCSDLLRSIDGMVELTCLRVKSYSGKESSGSLKWEYAPWEELENKHLLIVEDIVDTGLTLELLTQKLAASGALSVRSVAFLFKPNAFKGQIRPNYIGKEIENHFVVGYGMDYNGLGRNLSHIYKLSPSNPNES
jgi:hypoxanthine phosphoribosyltransferase